ncbi:carboxylesterase/lipase family protein, partial [Acinetobacter baumannii]
AINESGAFSTNMLDKATTKAITAEVLKTLGLQPAQADSLQTIPYPQLVNAGKSALKIITDKLKAEGKPITGFGLGWGPSVDGEDLPFQV